MSQSTPGIAPLPVVAPALPRAVSIAVLAGAITVVGVIAMPSIGWAGVLIASLYGITLALGAAVFVAIHAVAGARWWYPLRDVCLGVMRTLPAPALAALVTVGLGLTALYPWARPGAMAASHLLHEKAAWLNTPFFLARALVVVGLWLALTASLSRAVQRAWTAPGERSFVGMVRRGALFLLVFALSLSVAFWDWAMSLEPEWFGTMYGVYGFAGALQGGVAVITVLGILAARAKGHELPVDVQHDLAKLLFGFSFFWAYIWFSEAMLIWYANLPEETGHFATRLAGGWAMLFWLNPLLNFVIPFGMLMSARVKRHAPTVFQMSLVVLLGRWLDIHLLVQPSVESTPTLPIFAVAATVAMVVAMRHLYVGRPSAADAPHSAV